ncbi:MAG: alanine--tRNA ligase-related protein, partial [Pirellulaceae bacterium]
NVYPDSQKENYVIRRLLRRAVLQGHEMGLREPFLYQIVPAVVDVMARPYPDLRDTCDRVTQAVKSEEENFLRTLDDGLARMETIFGRMKTDNVDVVDGRQAFNLYQEQGIPAELFESIARDRGLGLDWEGYEHAREKHARDSGGGMEGVMGDSGPIDDIKREVKSTEFLGYACTSDNGAVVGLVADDQQVHLISAANDNTLVVLDRTPFYAESGGQVADTGIIVGPSGKFAVTDVKKSGDVFVHYGRVLEGTLAHGEQVAVDVDSVRRDGIQRAHSATHILHYALQKFLGEHAQQRGSKVEDDHLRFDFSNQEAVPRETLLKIEDESSRRVDEGTEVRAEILPLAEARQQGAMMLFGEKYPDPVRMVSIGDYSKELCGGTHVANSAEIVAFEIVGEEAVSAGTRRIVALTGEKARNNAQQTMSMLEDAAQTLRVPLSGLVDATTRLLKHSKDLKKQISGGKATSSTTSDSQSVDGRVLTYPECREILKQAARLLNVSTTEVGSRVVALQNEVEQLQQQLEQIGDGPDISADSLWDQAAQVGDISLVVCETPGANPNMMRDLIDQLRKKHPACAVFLASIQGADKVILVAGLSKDLVQRGLSAGDWVKNVAPTVGGGGGGKPDMAQAGGKQPDQINVALDAAREYLRTATVT